MDYRRIVIGEDELMDWLEEKMGGAFKIDKETSHIEKISLARDSYDIIIIIDKRDK